MKTAIILTLLTIASTDMKATHRDTLMLSLQDVVHLAQQQSPTAQSARDTYLSAYWNYRSFRANYLPSLTLSTNPYINREVNKITQSDGTSMFIRQDQFAADLTLHVRQNISWTGGTLFLKSSLSHLNELQHHTVEYSSRPIVVGYEQSLLGYNSLKWDKRIEPIRYREAKKQYAETLEIISATACNHFFALLSAQTELDMARHDLESADTLYSMAKGRYTIGTITENEMLQLEINRLNEETNVMDAEIHLKEVEQEVRTFLALDRKSELRLIVPDSVPQFQVSLTSAMEHALNNSPDPEYYKRIVKESESNLANSKANRRLRADLYLQFGLSQTGRDISSSYSHPMHQEYASISLTLPILDWGRGRGKVKVAQSQLALAQTQAEQGMESFVRNVEKVVMQFNMQARRVHIAVLTDERASQRHAVARRLYIAGRSSILDLNAAISEKNAARRSRISTMRTYWSLYYTLRSMTAYDFEHNVSLVV